MTAEELAQLHAACFTTPRPWRAAEFAELLQSPGAFLATRPNGFALGRVLADEAELLTIAVLGQARRAGLGRQLMHEFERLAVQRQARDAFLEVAADNVAAAGLYRAMGYDRAGLRKAYYHPPAGAAIDALIMRKALIAG